MRITISHSTDIMASAPSFMHAAHIEKQPSEETHYGASYSFLNIAPLPKKKKKKQPALKWKKRKSALRSSYIHTKKTRGNEVK